MHSISSDGPSTQRRLIIRLAVVSLLFVVTACSQHMTRSVSSDAGSSRAPGTDRSEVVATARGLIGVPYRYGGSTPETGFDCSGLVYYSYRRAGVSVPRTSAQQRKQSAPLAVSSLRPGDLVFFNTSAKSGHVGIYMGYGKFIHAPSYGGRVRSESIRSPYWRERLLGGGGFLGS